MDFRSAGLCPKLFSTNRKLFGWTKMIWVWIKKENSVVIYDPCPNLKIPLLISTDLKSKSVGTWRITSSIGLSIRKMMILHQEINIKAIHWSFFWTLDFFGLWTFLDLGLKSKSVCTWRVTSSIGCSIRKMMILHQEINIKAIHSSNGWSVNIGKRLVCILTRRRVPKSATRGC